MIELQTKMKRITLLLLILKANFGLYEAFGSGASPTACDSMKPGHGGTQALTSNPPFRLNPSIQSVEAGGTVDLILEGTTDSDLFKGFFVQAFDSVTNQRVGTFSPDSK